MYFSFIHTTSLPPTHLSLKIAKILFHSYLLALHFMKIASYFKPQLKTSLSPVSQIYCLSLLFFLCHCIRQVCKVFLWWVLTCMAMTAISRNLVWVSPFTLVCHWLHLEVSLSDCDVEGVLGTIQKPRDEEIEGNSYHNTVRFGPTSQ